MNITFSIYTSWIPDFTGAVLPADYFLSASSLFPLKRHVPAKLRSSTIIEEGTRGVLNGHAECSDSFLHECPFSREKANLHRSEKTTGVSSRFLSFFLIFCKIWFKYCAMSNIYVLQQEDNIKVEYIWQVIREKITWMHECMRYKCTKIRRQKWKEDSAWRLLYVFLNIKIKIG